MALTALRRYCLAKPGAIEEHPFGPGALVMKIGGRMFAIIGEDSAPITVSLKCEPEIALALRDAYASVAPGYHLNKRHWNTVTIDGTIGDERIREWIDDSFDLVLAGLPRKVRAEIARL
ncbi:MAG: MmcQ/YjbR family DNA-binding protein [Actinomycetota bacterium]